MRSRLTRRITAALVAATATGALAVAHATPAHASPAHATPAHATPAYAASTRPCTAGVWTQVAFYFNPLWFLTPRVTVFGSNFDIRHFGTGFPPYWQADNISGFSDVIIAPSVGTTLEVRCHANASFIGG